MMASAKAKTENASERVNRSTVKEHSIAVATQQPRGDPPDGGVRKLHAEESVNHPSHGIVAGSIRSIDFVEDPAAVQELPDGHQNEPLVVPPVKTVEHPKPSRERASPHKTV
jgi:hypothetical protein